MKKQQSKKVFAFSLLTISFIAILMFNTGCQKAAPLTSKPMTTTIIYTDINPDTAVSGNGTYRLDLNNDGIYDFTLNTITDVVNCGTRCRTSNRYIANVTIARGSNNGIVYKLADYLVSPLGSQSIIDSSSQWSYITDRALVIYVQQTGNCGTCSSYGVWGGNGDRYMGLKLVMDQNTYYGWVRLIDNLVFRKLIVQDYAYNSIPNQPILAGQTK